MHVVGDELAAFVQVAEGVAENGEGGREDLEGDVPAAFDYLFRCGLVFCPALYYDFWNAYPQNHPRRKQHTKDKRLQKDMKP